MSSAMICEFAVLARPVVAALADIVVVFVQVCTLSVVLTRFYGAVVYINQSINQSINNPLILFFTITLTRFVLGSTTRTICVSSA